MLVSIDAKLDLDTEELMSETSSAVYKVMLLVSLREKSDKHESLPPWLGYSGCNLGAQRGGKSDSGTNTDPWENIPFYSIGATGRIRLLFLWNRH